MADSDARFVGQRGSPCSPSDAALVDRWGMLEQNMQRLRSRTPIAAPLVSSATPATTHGLPVTTSPARDRAAFQGPAGTCLTPSAQDQEIRGQLRELQDGIRWALSAASTTGTSDFAADRNGLVSVEAVAAGLAALERMARKHRSMAELEASASERIEAASARVTELTSEVAALQGELSCQRSAYAKLKADYATVEACKLLDAGGSRAASRGATPPRERENPVRILPASNGSIRHGYGGDGVGACTANVSSRANGNHASEGGWESLSRLQDHLAKQQREELERERAATDARLLRQQQEEAQQREQQELENQRRDQQLRKNDSEMAPDSFLDQLASLRDKDQKPTNQRPRPCLETSMAPGQTMPGNRRDAFDAFEASVDHSVDPEARTVSDCHTPAPAHSSSMPASPTVTRNSLSCGDLGSGSRALRCDLFPSHHRSSMSSGQRTSLAGRSPVRSSMPSSNSSLSKLRKMCDDSSSFRTATRF